MFQTILLDSVILFLLVYALLDILTRIAEGVSQRVLSRHRDGAYHILFLEADEPCVEALIRRAVHEAGYSCPGVVLVDMGLPEEEREVARKLCGEYSCLSLYPKEEYLRMVEQRKPQTKLG